MQEEKDSIILWLTLILLVSLILGTVTFPSVSTVFQFILFFLSLFRNLNASENRSKKSAHLLLGQDSGKLFFLGRESRCLLWSLFWAHFAMILVSCLLPEPQRDSSQIFIMRADGVPDGKS